MSDTWAPQPTTNLPNMSITPADGLSINTVIVPVVKTVCIPLFVTDASKAILIATENIQITAIRVVYTVATASGTLQVEKLTGTTAPASGTNILTGTLDLTTAANTVLSGALTGTVGNLQLAAGNRLGVVFGGVLTGFVGGLMVIEFKRI